MDKKMLDSKIKNILIKVGFDFSHVGSHYATFVIKKILDSPESLHSLKNSIFAELAVANEITIGAIDRDIRWALRKAYENGNLKKVTLFKDRGAPTVKEFMNLIFDYIINLDYFSIN